MTQRPIRTTHPAESKPAQVISPQLLARLVCPASHQPLKIAPEDLVRRANAAQACGQLRNRAGKAVEHPLDGGLLRDDGQMLYAISAGIPIMLADEGIPVDQLA